MENVRYALYSGYREMRATVSIGRDEAAALTASVLLGKTEDYGAGGAYPTSRAS